MLIFKKRKIILLIGIILIFFSPFFSFAEAKRVVTIGYQEGTGMIDNLNNTGKEGIGFEILKKIESESDLSFEFVKYETGIFEALDNNDVDIVGLYFKTPELENDFIFMDVPLGASILSLATKGYRDKYYDDPQSIAGKVVATYPSNPSNALLDEYLVKNGISVSYLLGEMHTYLNLDADYYLIHTSNLPENDFYTALNLASMGSFLVSNEKNTQLMQEISDVFKRIEIKEGFFHGELLAKYNKNSLKLSHRELTRAEVELLQKAPLKVGYVESHRPFTFTNEEGQADGAIVSIMNELANKYSFEVEYFPYELGGALEDHENSDVLISLLGNTEHELEHYVPTESFYEAALVAITPTPVDDFSQNPFDVVSENSSIGITKYLYTDFSLFMNAFDTKNIVLFNSIDELLDSYKAGKVDMAVYTPYNSTYADAYLAKNKKYFFGTDFTLEFRFSISKNLPNEYVSIFNVMFDNLTPREYEDSITRYATTHYPKKTFFESIVENWPYVLIFLMLLAISILVYRNKLHEQKKTSLLDAYRTDDLTGLMSISYCYEKFQEVLLQIKPNEYEFISFDIDYFRTINSYYSMGQGTMIITTIAKELRKAFQGTDVLYARKTAEQFFILRKIGEGGSLQDIYYYHILPGIRSVIGDKYKVSLSFGSVIIDDCKESFSDIISYADYARVSGKSNHETTFIAFDKGMRDKFKSKLYITFRMEQAIKNKEFQVVYQPKVDFKTLKIVGAEALVRWQSLTGDVIYPNDFIEIFERNGFIATLDMYVFREVCAFIKNNSAKVALPIISVNLSAVSVLDNSLLLQLLTILEEYGVKSKQIDLEITETAILGAEDTFLSKIRQLKKAGFIVSIDDFGSGVSSLNRLCSIEADVLKMDKAFFDDNGNAKTTIIVDEVITLSKRLDMKIVAEGVETYEQAVWLQGLNCDTAQGYYFSKPVEGDTLYRFLAEDKTYELKKEEIKAEINA